MKKTTIFTSLLMACIIFLSSCFLDPEETTSGSSRKKAIELTVNQWASGNIVDENSGGTGEQWFKFVATAETQRVYVKFSTMTRMKVTIYDINYNSIGTSSSFRGDSGTSDYVEKSLNSGSTYYIKVEDSPGYYGYSGTGQYWIGFSASNSGPSK